MKMNKRYNKMRADIEARLSAVKTQLELLKAMPDDEKKAIPSGYWNALHGQRYDLERELDRMEISWMQRNWGWREWQENELIISNVD